MVVLIDFLMMLVLYESVFCIMDIMDREGYYEV